MRYLCAIGVSLAISASALPTAHAQDAAPAPNEPQHLDAIPFVLPADATEGQVIADTMPGDPRRTDGEGKGVPAGILSPPDLLHIACGRWRPEEAPAVQPIPPTFVFDEYIGAWDAAGEFLRVDLVFQGLINPPGPTASTFNPQAYGPSPLYGFVEFDIDRNHNTGGEVDEPEYRYNANVGRFGGHPAGPAYAERCALDGQATDFDPYTPLHIDRSGEDAHLAFFGDLDTIVRVVDVPTGLALCGEYGLPDCSAPGVNVGPFTAGDVWDVHGHFFSLAYGYLYFTLGPGYYQHLDRLRFEHDAERNLTQVSFIYPLTQRAWSLSHDSSTVSGMDFDNDAPYSLNEALYILQQSAWAGVNAGDPYHMLIADWACDGNTQPARCQQIRQVYLNPSAWRVTVIVETVTPDVPAGGQGLFAPTNVLPAVRPGDFNGDAWTTRTDLAMLDDFISLYDQNPQFDAGPGDGSNPDDGRVHIVAFGPNFSIFDVNYDGVVDPLDAALVHQDPADFDNDNDIDLRDFAMLQRCQSQLLGASTTTVPDRACLDAFDLDDDFDIDLDDYGGPEDGQGMVLTGPAF